MEETFLYEFNPRIEYKNIDFNKRGWRQRLSLFLDSQLKIKSQYDDLKQIKQTYDFLDKDLKLRYDKRTLELTVIFISVLCKMHLLDSFKADSNSVTKITNFIEKFLKSEKLHLFTFLCSHRGFATEQDNNELVNRIPDYYLENFSQIIINLFNIFEERKDKTFLAYQQYPGPLISFTMFPAMFRHYAINSSINVLFSKIQDHIKQILSYGNKFNTMKINFDVMDVSDHTQKVINFLHDKYGDNWHLIKNLNENDELEKIALNFTLKSMQRFFRTEEGYLHNINNEKQQVALIQETVDIARKYSEMSLEAKALFETTFYYLLGIKIAENDLFYLGFDRDSQLYQELAIDKGIKDTKEIFNKECNGAYLYARRTKDAKIYSDKGFSGISFRQFWR